MLPQEVGRVPFMLLLNMFLHRAEITRLSGDNDRVKLHQSQQGRSGPIATSGQPFTSSSSPHGSDFKSHNARWDPKHSQQYAWQGAHHLVQQCPGHT
jgi:hypothetical protein